MKMLEVLRDLEPSLHTLLGSAQWQSLLIDYHPPIVRRLWLQHGAYRVYLHEIDPCTREQALMHPHPWPSAVKIVGGFYEMGVGYGKGQEVPPVTTRMMLTAGSEYEMTDPDCWHYVRPVNYPSYSIMVTGQPWDRPFDVKPEQPLKPLGPADRTWLVLRFGDLFRSARSET